MRTAMLLVAVGQATVTVAVAREMLAGNPEYRAHLVWVDDDALAFLARDPTLLGTTLVAPRAHREQQLAALSWERGMVALPDHDMADLAGRLRARVERMRQGL
jgi:hypothetical protein